MGARLNINARMFRMRCGRESGPGKKVCALVPIGLIYYLDFTRFTTAHLVMVMVICGHTPAAAAASTRARAVARIDYILSPPVILNRYTVIDLMGTRARVSVRAQASVSN